MSDRDASGNESAPNASGGLMLFQPADGGDALRVRVEGETVWLTQRQIADLFQITAPTVNEHLRNIDAEGELDPGPTIRKFRIVQTEGARQVSRTVDHYALDAILPSKPQPKNRRSDDPARA